jgi:hypothetical protein
VAQFQRPMTRSVLRLTKQHVFLLGMRQHLTVLMLHQSEWTKTLRLLGSRVFTGSLENIGTLAEGWARVQSPRTGKVPQMTLARVEVLVIRR